MKTLKQTNRLKQIAISQENYVLLKKLGTTGDSFNDVVTEVLRKIKLSESDSKVGPAEQITTNEVKFGEDFDG